MFDFSQEAVEKRLEDARQQMKNLDKGAAPKSGYLDTQLFPGKKDPKPYEKDY